MSRHRRMAKMARCRSCGRLSRSASPWAWWTWKWVAIPILVQLQCCRVQHLTSELPNWSHKKNWNQQEKHFWWQWLCAYLGLKWDQKMVPKCCGAQTRSKWLASVGPMLQASFRVICWHHHPLWCRKDIDENKHTIYQLPSRASQLIFSQMIKTRNQI